GATFTIQAPNTFVRDWLETRLNSTITRTLRDLLRCALEVRYRIAPEDSAPTTTPVADLPLVSWGREAQPFVRPAPQRLIDKYSFATFVVGDSNQLAHAAAEAVTQNPGVLYNPLFIYSPSGLGKTHLLHAIGLAARDRGLSVVYVTSEAFTVDFITAIRERATDAFRARYRTTDLLLIDDVQFLATKEQTQDEFFHTFNDLHHNGKQIVLTSDRAPKLMSALEERLRSRFEWGLITDMQPPTYEMRVAILESKARQKDLTLPADVLDLMARRINGSVRELEGQLNTLALQARVERCPISYDFAHRVLFEKGAIAQPRRRIISVQQVIEAVAAEFHLNVEDLKGKRRDKDTALARHTAMYLAREMTSSTLSEIGHELRRDHTTVMHGVEKIGEEVKKDLDLQRRVNMVKMALEKPSPDPRRR
ncbi:MAG: chromosomal replication initiator protein DnaA, partial [Dehalococcoidia bacterium]|nr:chromosomal replication initiator protein DnaA [Dehalococcoidia bacterium]